MAERPVGELNGDKPTVRAKLLSVIGPHGQDLATERAVSTKWLP
jgi:hypothetical protein